MGRVIILSTIAVLGAFWYTLHLRPGGWSPTMGLLGQDIPELARKQANE